jgi:hypothetical protein
MDVREFATTYDLKEKGRRFGGITLSERIFSKIRAAPDRCGYLVGHVLLRIKSDFIFSRSQRSLNRANPLAPLKGEA